MLILFRKPGETLRIGDDITVTVTEIAEKQVKIGVRAPKEVTIHRKEIYDRIQCKKVDLNNPEDTTDEF